MLYKSGYQQYNKHYFIYFREPAAPLFSVVKINFAYICAYTITINGKSV
jgi:hypothetical protein